MNSLMLGVVSVVIAVSGLADKPHRAVYIRDCAGQFIPVYSDSRMTQPLPNPFLADAHGKFTFYTDQDCIEAKSSGKRPSVLPPDYREHPFYRMDSPTIRIYPSVWLKFWLRWSAWS